MPAENVSAVGCVPALFDNTVVLARVVPDKVYVPIPTSHSDVV